MFELRIHVYNTFYYQTWFYATLSINRFNVIWKTYWDLKYVLLRYLLQILIHNLLYRILYRFTILFAEVFLLAKQSYWLFILYVKAINLLAFNKETTTHVSSFFVSSISYSWEIKTLCLPVGIHVNTLCLSFILLVYPSLDSSKTAH